MSKWSKRSDEEKKKIFEEQEKKREEAERKKTQGTMAVLKDEDAVAIYDQKEIPLPCLNCGWTGSEQYRRVIKPHFVTGVDGVFIEGKCRKCGRTVMRAMPSVFESEAALIMMTMQLLSQQGRLK